MKNNDPKRPDLSEGEWEILDEEVDCGFSTDLTARMSVPGGWLYRVEIDKPSSDESRQFALAVAFVPDPPIRSRATKGPPRR